MLKLLDRPAMAIRARASVCAAVLLALITGASTAALADHYPRQPGVKVLRYSFDVALSDQSDELSVRDTIDIQLLASNVPALDLDLCQRITESRPPDRLNPCLVPQLRPRRGSAAAAAPAPVSSVGRGMTVTAVTMDGQPATFQHNNDRLHISLSQPNRAGQKITIVVNYRGIPATGLFIGKNGYGDRVWFTDNWPNKARNWLATIDHISVKAPKTISVTAPAYYHVISNGRLLEQTDLPGDMRRTVWEETQPIPSWQFSLGVAPMSVTYFGAYHGIPFSAWLFPQDHDSGMKAIDPLTQSVFEFYSDHIGPYAYEKLAQVDAVGGSGATEFATNIFYYNAAWRAISHEMAHQWFGNAVTESDWDDVWLSEGFATYFALLYTEHEDGHDAFLRGVSQTRDRALAYVAVHPDDTVVHNNLANDSDVFFNSAQIYMGGAMVLQTLRGVLGDELFWKGIRLYYSRFSGHSASTDDFRHAMEDACTASGKCPAGDDDLSWFFSEWLHRGGFLQLKGSWHYDAASKQLQLAFDQTQTQGVYRMPMEIAVTLPPAQPNQNARQPESAPIVRMEKVVLDRQHNTFSIPLDAAPTNVQVDPDLWIPLMKCEFEKK